MKQRPLRIVGRHLSRSQIIDQRINKTIHIGGVHKGPNLSDKANTHAPQGHYGSITPSSGSVEPSRRRGAADTGSPGEWEPLRFELVFESTLEMQAVQVLS